MEALDMPLKVLSVFGIWKPANFTSNLNKLFNDLSSIIFFPLQFLLTFGLISRLAIQDINFNEFAETLFLTLTVISGTGKSIFFLFRRKHIVKLSNRLLANCARPQCSFEKVICDKYDKTIRYLTIMCASLIETTVMIWLVAPFFQTKNHRILPFKIWLPFDEKPESQFWLTYVPEALAIICSSVVGILADTIISGFIIATCGQFDLLSYRIFNVSNYKNKIADVPMTQLQIDDYEKGLIDENIRHHLFIFEFADAVRDTFQPVIFMQFTASSVIIAMSVYQLSTIESINMEFFSKLFYLNSMLAQFFIYCWFGNELTIKSQEFGNSMLYSNWMAHSVKANKQLMIITERTTKPIIFSTGHFIVLSVNSFTNILKASYTAFNVLRTSSTKN